MIVDDLVNLLISLVKNKKVIGIKDLQNAASKSGINILIDDEVIGELCFRLREEGIIAHSQGKGVFKHIRVVD